MISWMMAILKKQDDELQRVKRELQWFKSIYPNHPEYKE